MEISKKEAELYLHEKFVVSINKMGTEPHFEGEVERQMECLWGALGVLKNFGILTVAECQSVLNQVGSSSVAFNL